MELSTLDDKNQGKRTLQQSVYDTILEGIARGEWKETDKIPSVRAMAERLNVHRLTVLKAYQLLLEDGIVEVKYKSGYFVAGKTEDTLPESLTTSPRWAYQAKSVYVNRSRLSDIHRHQVEYQMSEALIDPGLLPNAFLSNHVKQVFDMYPKVLSTYSSVSGDLELREEMARYFMDKQGITVHPEELLITTGSQQAIDLISRSLVKSGDCVLIERPTYSPAIDVFVQQNVKLLPIEITPEGYDLERIEGLMRAEKPKLFYMNPTFQNPTGYTVPITQRKALVELAERYQCILVEDEVYHDIYFGDPPPLPFLLRHRRLCHSHSKLQQICGPRLADIGAGCPSGTDECHPSDQGVVGQRDAAADAKDFPALFLLEQTSGACGQAADCAGAS